MLLKTAISLFSVAVFASASDYSEVFLNLCGDGEENVVELSEDDIYSVMINTASWPSDKLSCSVVFMVDEPLIKLYYEFHTFHLSGAGINVTIESKYIYIYTTEARYSFGKTPDIEDAQLTDKYLRVNVTRSGATYGSTLLATFDVYPSDNDFDSFSAGAIVGIVFGALSFIFALSVFTAYCICMFKAGKQTAGSVVTTSVHNQNGHAMTTVSVPVYPPVASSQQHAVHPSHAAYQTYPAQATATSPADEHAVRPFAESPPPYPGPVPTSGEEPEKIKY